MKSNLFGTLFFYLVALLLSACATQSKDDSQQNEVREADIQEHASANHNDEDSAFDHIKGLSGPGTPPDSFNFPDVPYVPTPEEVVRLMLHLGEVDEKDLVYDLGSGDGRIPILAAEKLGARGVGVEIDPELIELANDKARYAGVSDRVQFIHQDLFEVDLSKATVVTLYLLPDVNLKLRPKLLKELKPGTRIVSHAFDMGDWEPEKVEKVAGRTVYLWTVPEKIPEHLK